jgi:hypothetical protein
VLRPPKQFGQHSAGHVERLDHEVVHIAGKVKGLGDGLEFAPPEARRENKDGQENDRADSDVMDASTITTRRNTVSRPV